MNKEFDLLALETRCKALSSSIRVRRGLWNYGSSAGSQSKEKTTKKHKEVTNNDTDQS